MVEIELPCCGNVTNLDDLADSVRCEACCVILELGDTAIEALPVAA